eukprot:9953487-Lingulodinium_polyedra.AAC.1
MLGSPGPSARSVRCPASSWRVPTPPLFAAKHPGQPNVRNTFQTPPFPSKRMPMYGPGVSFDTPWVRWQRHLYPVPGPFRIPWRTPRLF